MDETLRQLVWDRARDACEYCRVPQQLDILPFQIDHIIAIKHHGPTIADNLALCCFNDNLHKGSNIAGIDPETKILTRLFHPRLDLWQEHFAWNGSEIVGLTDVGRTTVDVLNINLWERVEHRRLLRLAGLFPS